MVQLDRDFGVHDEGRGHGRRIYLDTPDRALISRGERLWLCRQGTQFDLCHRRRGRRVVTERGGAMLPQSIQDLPATLRRGALRDIDPQTALQVVAVVDWQLHFTKLESASGLAPLVIEQRSTSHQRRRQRLPSVIVVEPGAGAEVIREIADVAHEHGFRAWEEDELEAILRMAPRPKKRRSAWKQPAGTALQAALREQRAALRQWLPLTLTAPHATRGDRATTALHQLRVALRHTRALLANFRALLPAQAGTRFARDFAWIHAASSTMRDLDVLHQQVERAARETTSNATAGSSNDEFGALLAALDDARREAAEAWIKVAQSKRTQRFFDLWDALLSSDAENFSAHAAKALGPLVSKRLRQRAKCLRRAIKAAAASQAETPANTAPATAPGELDEELHAVRIAAKKLRYVLESFRGLCHRKSTESMLRTLRRVQDSLGARHDEVVQRQRLQALALSPAATRDADRYLAQRKLQHAHESTDRQDLRKLKRALRRRRIRRILAR